MADMEHGQDLKPFNKMIVSKIKTALGFSWSTVARIYKEYVISKQISVVYLDLWLSG